MKALLDTIKELLMAQGPDPRPAHTSLTSTTCCLTWVCLQQCLIHHECMAVRSTGQQDSYHLAKKGYSQQSRSVEQTPGEARYE